MIETLTFTSHLSDIPEAERAQLPMPPSLRHKLLGERKDRLRLIAVTVGPFAVFGAAAISLPMPTAGILLLFVAFMFWFFIAQRLTMREVERLKAKAALRMDIAFAPDEVTLSKSGITRMNAYWEHRFRWSLYAGAAQGREGLYIWLGPQRAIYVPDAALPSGAVRDDLRQAVEDWANG